MTSELRLHKELRVQQKAIELVVTIDEVTKRLPKIEQYGLTSQLQRAAVSVPTNIAEGNSRGSRKDYARLVDIAKGSNSELETLLTVVEELGLVSKNETVWAQMLTNDVGRMLTGLKIKLSQEDGGFWEEDQARFACSESPVPSPESQEIEFRIETCSPSKTSA